MTTPTLTAVPSARRTRLLPAPPRRRYLVPTVLAVVFVVTEGLAQAVTPFIRNDDWPFLLPPHLKGVLPISYWDKSEGRWLNTVWWTLIGQHGSATGGACCSSSSSPRSRPSSPTPRWAWSCSPSQCCCCGPPRGAACSRSSPRGWAASPSRC